MATYFSATVDIVEKFQRLVSKEWACKRKNLLQSSLVGMELLDRAAVNVEDMLNVFPRAHLELTATDMIRSMEAIADKDSPEYWEAQVK